MEYKSILGNNVGFRTHYLTFSLQSRRRYLWYREAQFVERVVGFSGSSITGLPRNYLYFGWGKAFLGGAVGKGVKPFRQRLRWSSGQGHHNLRPFVCLLLSDTSRTRILWKHVGQLPYSIGDTSREFHVPLNFHYRNFGKYAYPIRICCDHDRGLFAHALSAFFLIVPG